MARRADWDQAATGRAEAAGAGVVGFIGIVLPGVISFGGTLYEIAGDTAVTGAVTAL